MAVVTATGKDSGKSTTGKGSKDFPAIDDGVYVAEVVRCQYRDRDNADFWPSFKTHDAEINWGFKITSGEYKNRWFFLDTELSLEPGSDLRHVIKELLLKDDLDEGFSIDTDDLSDWEGLDCRIRVEKYYSNKHKEFRNAIREVLRPTDAMYGENPF